MLSARKVLIVVLLQFTLGVSASAAERFADIDDVGVVPYIDAKGKSGYRSFLDVRRHRAFAISPTGSWGWRGGTTGYIANRDALANCQAWSQVKCRLYAVDNEVVWQPQPEDEDLAAASDEFGLRVSTEKEARNASAGFRVGDRLPDLALQDLNGNSALLSDFREKFVFLHFWGSWCPPCRVELPGVYDLYTKLEDEPTIEFVLVTILESLATSKHYISGWGYDLPLYKPADHRVGLVTFQGGVARSPGLPTTYLIDPHGIIMFKYEGPYVSWSKLAGPLRGLAEN